MIQTSIDITVRYSETDMMGHANHGNYFSWFEVGRVHQLNKIGSPYKELEEDGFALPVLEAHAKFIKPLYFEDTVTIISTMHNPPKARFRIDYELRRGEILAATGYTIHGFINKSGHPVRPPKAFIEKLESFF